MAEAYPDAYLRQALPLVFITGLSSNSSVKKEGEEQEGPRQGLKVFASSEQNNEVSWPGRDILANTFIRESCPNPGIWVKEIVGNKSRNPSPVIKMKLVNRQDMVLPINKRSTSGCKHTPLSPLNPASPLYPDGCMTHEWVEKYTEQLPAVLISLYDQSSLESSQDRFDKVCLEIDEVKRKLNLYGIRLVIVILGDGENERLAELFATIRKRCSIDSKSGLLHLGSTDVSEIDRFVQTLKSTMLPPVLDFYQLQIKKIKRKKGRHSPLPIDTDDKTDSRQEIQIPLLTSGWHARYDYKMAVFNELKLDMESAVRQYETAYESMVEGFEPIPPFTQRWNEQRLLLDVIAFKVFKLYLYLEMPTLAQRKLNVHMITVRALVSKVIPPSKNNSTPLFSCAVWESIQFELIGELMHMVPESISPRSYPFISTQSAPASYPAGDMLHHAGFFMWRAAEAYQERMSLRHQEEQDKCTYLLWTESKIDYIAKIVYLYDIAVDEFETSSNYPRFVANLLLKKSICLQDAGNYHQALTELKRVAFSYRGDCWNNLLQLVLERCLECAQKTASRIELASIVYELESLDFQSIKGLEVLESSNEWTELEFPPDSVITSLTGSFMFDTPRITIGQSVGCQLVVSNNSKKFQISEIEIGFDDEAGGNVTKVIIHDNGKDVDNNNKKLIDVGTLESIDKTNFTASGALSSNDSVTIVQFKMPIHHYLGLWTTRYIIATVKCDEIKTIVRQGLRVRYNIDDCPPIWWGVDGSQLVPGIIVNGKQPWRLNVVPRTSRVDIQLNPRPQQPVYCEELVHIPVKIINNEDFQIENGKITLKLEQIGGNKQMQVHGLWERAAADTLAADDGKDKQVRIPNLNPGESVCKDISILAPNIASEVVVHMDMEYVVSNDLETDISKSQSITLSIVKPFDSKYTFSPQVLPDEWSSFFLVDIDSEPRQTPVMKRRWRIDTQILSQASIQIVDYSLEFVKTVGVECKVIKEQKANELVVLENEQEGTISFEFDATNDDVLDKRVGYVEAVISISWQRKQSEILNTTSPKLAPLKLSLPLSEPRLLVSLERGCNDDGICDLIYYLENPTGMMLTFSITMESSSDLFAYGGYKHENRVRVLPFSRKIENYQLLILQDEQQEKKKLRLPVLRVFDVYFKRALAPIPACTNLKLEKSGDIFIVNQP